MEWNIVAIYILGIFFAHLIIYRNGEENVDHITAAITCIAWTVVSLIICLMQILK